MWIETKDKGTCRERNRPTAGNHRRPNFFTNIKSRSEITITSRNIARDVYQDIHVYRGDRANGTPLLNQLSSFKYPQKHRGAPGIEDANNTALGDRERRQYA